VWIDDAHYLWPKTDRKAKTSDWRLVEADTGKSEPFAPAAKLEKALGTTGIGAEKAKRLAYSDAGAWSDDPKALLFTIEQDVWVYTIATDTVRRATTTPDLAEEEAALSPDGQFVAFVRDHDLYVADVATGTERRLTNDGSATVLNGKLDWLYQEEVYGRGTWRAFWWSPDSRHLAFLRLDEAGVPIYTLVDDVASPAEVETSPYPRAGDTNPTVKLGIAHIEGGGVDWTRLSDYSEDEPLIVDVGWSPAGDLVFQLQNRVQSWLDLLRVPASEAQGSPARAKDVALEPTLLIHETSDTWVNVNGAPHWLADGSFLWFSERTGWKHLYRYDPDGNLRGAVTSGEWEARDLRGVDEANGLVYFSGTERSPIAGDEYSVRLDGQGLHRLTTRPGSHSARPNPSFTRFLDHWSDLATPTQVRLHRADGSEVRVIDANPVPELARYGFVEPELLRVPTRDGFEMEAMLLRPPGFDPKRRYPVFQHTYAGPHAPQVKNGWMGTNGMFFQLLAQRGVVVWICDNRSASGKGAVSERACYKQFGKTEMADIEDGVAWLKKQSWVDPDRIGISGWSYGGFMASYALTHSKSFAMGIAGGSVTNFANYDSIYTERFMLRPEDNPEGYAGTSVVDAAANLHGELLLVHGALDDNVHPQNTMQFAYALQQAGKPFRLMLYPKSRHGVGDPKLVKHFRAMMLDFVEETLLGRPSS
jgi:dipeptidyl-peptidase-4